MSSGVLGQISMDAFELRVAALRRRDSGSDVYQEVT